MPESREKPFPPEQNKPKSPEQIKEEKGLALAQEINEIKQRMAKEGKTSEGFQRIIELAKKIEKIYREKELTFRRGEVIDHLLNLEKISSVEIKDAFNIYRQPDGTLAGSVKLEDGRWVPFTGDKLLEKISGKEIKDVKHIYTQPDGTLAGKVELEDGRWVPFTGDKLLEKISGKEIEYAGYIHTQPDGTLAGSVQLEDGRFVNFFWDGERLIVR